MWSREQRHYAHLRPAPRHAFARMFLERDRDEIELSVLNLFVPPGRESIDVGANLGRYAIELSKLSRHVWAFEPNPRLARFLSAALPANVSVRQAAVSNAAGRATLTTPLAAGPNAAALATLETGPRQGPTKSLSVETVVLDDLADRDIGFVKIDVEGHELAVLEGAERLIERQRPVVLVEAEDRHRPGATRSVFSFLAERNYRGFFIHRGRLNEVAEFDLKLMQDPALLNDRPRGLAPYVNNFLFFPTEAVPAGLVEAAAGRLSERRA